MVFRSNLQGETRRFGNYIEELHQFLDRSGVPFGLPRDLPPFVARLAASSSFHKDVCSLLRAIIYRENTAITSTELLELLAVAVGGPDIEGAAEAQRDSIARLFAFVREVYRTLHHGFTEIEEGEVSEAPASPTFSSAPPETGPPSPSAGFASPASTHPMPPHTEAASAPLVVPPGSQSPSAGAEEANWMGQVPSFSLKSAAEDNRPPQNEASSVQELPTPQPSSLSQSSRPQRAVTAPSPGRIPGKAPNDSPYARRFRGGNGVPAAIWIAAAATLVLAFIGGALLHRRSTPLPDVPVARHPRRAVEGAMPSTPASQPSTFDREWQDLQAANTSQDMPAAGSSAPHVNQTRPQAGTRLGKDTSAKSSPEPPSPPPETAAIAGDTGAARTAVHASPEPIESSPGGVRPTRPERPTRSAAAAASPGVFNVSSGLMAANLLSAPSPGYPKLASLAHVQGDVILQAVVSRDGRVVTTHVLSGHRLLRGAATGAVRQWRYRPYLLKGRPIDVATVVTVEFRLHR